MLQQFILILIVFSFFIVSTLIGTTVRKRKKRDHDYYAIFIMGLVWLIFGLILNNPPLWLMGSLFSVTALMHKREWSARRNWKALSIKEKIIKAICIFLSVILGGLTFWLFHSIIK